MTKSPEFQGPTGDFQGISPQFEGPAPLFQALAPDFQAPCPLFQGPTPDFEASSPEFQGPAPQFQGIPGDFHPENRRRRRLLTTTNAVRGTNRPTFRDNHVGFRCVLSAVSSFASEASPTPGLTPTAAKSRTTPCPCCASAGATPKGCIHKPKFRFV